MRALRLRAAIIDAAFDCRTFLVIVPGRDHHERQRVGIIVVTAKNMESVLHRLSAPPCDVAVQAPRGARVIKPRPGAAYGDFVRIPGLHALVEIFKILLAPIAAVAREVFARSHPGVKPVHGVRVLGTVVLVNEQRRRSPRTDVLLHAEPVGVPTLGKNKYERTAVVRQISATPRSTRLDV